MELPDDIPDEEELQRLFDSDFSDLDPTYQPDKEDLITPEDLGIISDLKKHLYSEFSSERTRTPSPDNGGLAAREPVPGTSAASHYKNLSTANSLCSSPVIDLEGVFIPEGDFAVENRPNLRSEGVDVASWLLDKLLSTVWKSTRVFRRWRTADPGNWAKNIAKKRRAEGLTYMTSKKHRSAKVPKDIDCSKCIFKCNDKFNDEERNQLCCHYWALDYKEKKSFILSNITVDSPKRVVTARKSSKCPRKYTKKCFLPNFVTKTKQQVCQNFFLKTFCICQSVVADAVEKRNNIGQYSHSDKRGKHTPPNKTNQQRLQVVRSHIESFPCMEPHYIRQSSKRKYLDKSLSIKKMYDLYKEECLKKEIEPVNEITYRRTFSNEYNLSFFVPKKDQCLTCNKYERANDREKRDIETDFQDHVARKEACNEEKRKDKERANKDKNFNSVTFDLQAVLQIPCGLVGQLYYCRKICVYNLCVYEAALPNEAFCFTWSEINGKRGSCEIGSVLFYYLSNCVPTNISEISLFSDTCGGQNRNQFVVALLLYAVQKIDHLHIIEHKFLESGHSYMEVDSMHSSIETAKKHTSVYSMSDYKSLFQRARSKQTLKVDGKKITKNPYKVKEFKFNEFFDLKALTETMITNRAKDSEGKTVNWLKIKRFRFLKSERNKVFFNYDMSENFLTLEVRNSSADTAPPKRTRLQRKSANTSSSQTLDRIVNLELKQLYTQPLPISSAKKQDLIKLCEKGVIPEEFHGWYKSLRADNGLSDRLPEANVDEDSETE